MPGKQKIIGVCLSQAYNYINAGYISELERAARREGYRVVVYNTMLDFYWYGQGNSIARSIFRAINYDQLSALVIIHESFHDAQLMDEILQEATARQVPVFCLGAVWEGCISILYDYEKPYKDLLRHVISDHGARDTFYISGMENESNSALRIQCYRKTLAECGLPWKPENVAYGMFIEGPTRAIVEELIRTRQKMPEAIFCANDYMAMTVCATLKDHGIRVPEDVMVTGFDGIPIAALYSPQLATCSQDAAALAEKTMELTLALARGEQVEPVQHHLYRAIPAESCGCPSVKHPEMDALTLFRRMEEQNGQENHLYHTVERMLMRENLRDLLLILSHALPPDSAVYLNASFLKEEQDEEYDLNQLEPELIRIQHQNMDVRTLETQRVKREDLAMAFGDRPGITLFTAIHSDTTVMGCFAAHTESLEDHNQIIKRMSDVLDMTFTVVHGNARQKKLLHHLEDTVYQDSMTGLPNLKGLSRWFDQYAGDLENRHRCVALSVYNIHRYDYLYETYGIGETEEITRLVGGGLKQVNPEALCVARISEAQFVVVNDAADMAGISQIIDRSVQDFYRKIDAYNIDGGKSYFLEVNCGCTTMERGWKDATLENLIHLAVGEMYLNRMRSGSHEAEKTGAGTDARMYSAFQMLIERNLFLYHFQPIVDARTGQIVAYEALMRTDAAVGLSPLEILEIAREYNHLYEVERLTLFGIMDRFTRDHSRFHQNRVFINTIPGHFLTPEDCETLRARYGSYLDRFVFELTEQDATSDEELTRLKRINKAGGQTQIAIDDYGTGHSNIVNLLRYAPQIIKIDRGLISGIQDDANKQLFVRNTIDFAHKNGIQALAEGVETAEELRFVIDCGADLIQGFYTARPAAEPLDAIPREIREEILEANRRRAEEDVSRRMYQAV